MMLENIKHFFESHIRFSTSEQISAEQLRSASAALLMEMVHSHETMAHEKQDLVLNLLESAFSLTEQQATSLIDIAEHNRKQATDYYEFTHLICTEFSHDQKLQLIEHLWKIAFVDNKLAVEEEYLVDKIARLLFIPHAQLLEARNRARADRHSHSNEE